MVAADFIFIAGLLLFIILGFALGFGKQLSILTKGIFGIIISVVICYFVFGLVYNIPFVQSLLAKFKESLLATEKPIVKFLLTIRIDIIVYAIALFIVVSIVRIIIVLIIKNVMEIETTVMKIINKTLGVILGIAVFFGLGLIVMQIMYLSGDGAVPEKMVGSFFRLDVIYANNPLTKIAELFA